MKASQSVNQNYKKSLAVLEEVAGRSACDGLDIDKAWAIHESDRNAAPESLRDLILNPLNYLILSDWIPRNSSVAEKWLQQSLPYEKAENISQLLNDDEIDPHLMYDLVKLREAVASTGFQPERSHTTTDYKPRHLILFGTGCGRAFLELVKYLQPTHISIVSECWEDWASSFFSVDWLEIWNQYCSDPAKGILSICADDSLGVIGYLSQHLLTLLDHSFVYASPTASEKLKSYKTDLLNGRLVRQINYTGFVMDEYNMIYNAWMSLRSQPRIYRRPSSAIQVAGTIIVCGSGPSLDCNLSAIKKASELGALVISCASNYGTLRKASIPVDILCLLERGDFMVDQYTTLVSQYGSGDTRLLASVTTPSALQGLFKEPMVYFRSALTPLSIFADGLEQVLYNEGPQTVNTGASIATLLQPDRIILVGVDLGARSAENVRSNAAIGESPRTFDIQTEANLGGQAITNEMLIDGARVLEDLAKVRAGSMQMINASDGIRIKGWESSELHVLLSESPHQFQCDKEQVWRWWSSCHKYKLDRFHARWISSSPRQSMYAKIQQLIKLLKSSAPFYPTILTEAQKLLSIDRGTKQSQIASRIIRGHILKMLFAIQRQSIIMSAEPEKHSQFHHDAVEIIIARLRSLQSECFQLFDLLDEANP